MLLNYQELNQISLLDGNYTVLYIWVLERVCKCIRIFCFCSPKEP